MIKINNIYNVDCLEGFKEVFDKSITLAIVDPPYNINKAYWDDIDDYINWCGLWIKELERVLKDNGSLYIFHNQFNSIRDMDFWIDINTDLIFKQLIIWNKRYKGSKNYGYLSGFNYPDNKRNYEKMCEYILYYTFDNSYKIRERREELGLSQKVISEEVKSVTDGITGWVSNIEKGLSYPNKEHIKAFNKHLGIDVTEFLPIFNNQKSHHSVWNYDIANKSGHITPKPVDMLKNIILHSSNKGDIILDPFVGSGNTEIACIKTNRNYIGFEINKEYYHLANNRIRMINTNRFI
jgi:site-specific DNA-methyltransferase (adenine-specific)